MAITVANTFFTLDGAVWRSPHPYDAVVVDGRAPSRDAIRPRGGRALVRFLSNRVAVLVLGGIVVGSS